MKISKEFIRYIFSREYLLTRPHQESKYLYVWLIFYVLLLGSAVFFRIYFAKAYKSEAYSSFAKKLFWGNLLFAIIGLFLAFSNQQLLPIFSFPIMNILLLISLFSFNIYLYIHKKKAVTKKYIEESHKKRIEKWLPGQSKKA